MSPCILLECDLPAVAIVMEFAFCTNAAPAAVASPWSRTAGSWPSSPTPRIPPAPELVYHPDRLTTPLRRTASKGAQNPDWRAISWDAALSENAERMAGIRREHGAEQVAFSVTTPLGSHLQDCIPWIERFSRACGSPNTICETEICIWHKDHADVTRHRQPMRLRSPRSRYARLQTPAV